MRAPLLLSVGTVCAALLSGTALAADDFSPAEKAIFMSDQLGPLHPPLTLRYSFRKSGTLEPGFDDSVALTLNPTDKGVCCAVHGEFLSGPRRTALPDIDYGSANPVTLYFLERDIREMGRITQGSQGYFRKRIRMAAYQGATVAPASFRYQGKTIAGQEITLKPYLDDPNHARFEKFTGKEYHFLLSDAVPGGVYAIRTLTAGGSGGEALLSEELLIDGAEPAAH